MTPQARVDQTQRRSNPRSYVQGVMTPAGARPAFRSVARRHAGVGPAPKVAGTTSSLHIVEATFTRASGGSS